MLIPATATSESDVRPRPTAATLLLLDDEQLRERLESGSTDEVPELAIESVPTYEDARERRNDVDCLAIALPQAAADDAADGADGVPSDTIERLNDLLETIRNHVPELPIVVLVDRSTPEVVRAVRSHDWTAVVERDEAIDRLAYRVHDLVERRRLATLSRRSLASVEFAGDAIAIVDPDDEIQFASRSFAMQFGYDRDSLPETSWRTLFTDAAVDHLESTAIPTVTDGWRWTGTCTARRKSDATFSAQVRLGRLEDGSLVFVVDESDASDGLEN